MCTSPHADQRDVVRNITRVGMFRCVYCQQVRRVHSLRICNLPDTQCDPPSGQHPDNQLTALDHVWRVKVIHLEYFSLSCLSDKHFEKTPIT